jgi:hypothetical protein
MRRARIWVALGAALGVAALSGVASADRDRPARAAGGDITDWRLSKHGLGPLRVGLTGRQVESRTGYELEAVYGSRPCRIMNLSGAPEGIGLMFAYGKLVRVSVFRRPWRTKRGIRVGMRGRAVRRRHPNLRVRRHPYTPRGRYLIVGGKPKRMIFETGARGRVTSFRGGFSRPVGYIEGCA